MKKLSLLFTMLALLVTAGAQAASYKLGKSLTLEEALTKENVALVFQKDASSALQVIYYDTAKEHTSTDGQTHFTLGAADTVFTNANAQYKFKIAAGMTYKNATAYSVQFTDDNKYFTIEWNGEHKADSKDNRPFTITAANGITNGYNFICYRTDDPIYLKSTVNKDASGNPVDSVADGNKVPSKDENGYINYQNRGITFAGNGGTDAYWVNGIIYMYEIEEVSSSSYDQVITTPITDSSLFPLTEGSVDTKIWPTDGKLNSYDASTKTITIGSWGNAVGWTFDTTDLSSYNKLVIELDEALSFSPQVRFRNATTKSTGKDVHYVGLTSGQTKYEIDLTATQFKYDDQKSNPDVNLDLTDINAIYFWAWDSAKVIKLKDVYLVKATGETSYLVRENTTADKYGTICLPFAASAPSNAKVYSVVGYDDSNVYLKEATSLEAGKAYVFQSSDANDITFTKNSSDENLTAPTSATSGLIGTFTASTSVPANSYILKNGTWLKVAENGNNTVNAYRAYLTLGDDLKVASSTTAKAMRINSGQTTAINSVNAATNAAAPAFNLAGQRVGNGYKGVVVKNGKKYIVK